MYTVHEKFFTLTLFHSHPLYKTYQIIISQVNKRLTENSILTKELQSKPSTVTSISNNLPPSYNTSANLGTTKSSVQSLQTLTTVKGDEASVNNIHSKSIFLSTPSNSNNLWSSIKVSNNEPMVTTSFFSMIIYLKFIAYRAYYHLHQIYHHYNLIM
ncbi:unnamed protein product [Schistosoma intercalatum]|nr:unnamed protein product [Schistosoma intercalatum]